MGINTLVEDIYSTVIDLSNGDIKITEKEAETFGEEMKEAIIHWSTPQEKEGVNLRMSNVGRPDKQIWYSIKEPSDEKENLDAPTHLKFLMGHMLESLVLFLCEKAGHEVTDRQKQVTLNDVNGSIDSIIDGYVIDVKTASPFGMKKFKEGTLFEDDPFGYLGQLAGYEEALGLSGGGFLAIDKASGEIVLYRPDELDKPNMTDRINTLREQLKKDTPPTSYCYQPIPDGKSGNMRINKGCKWCSHKKKCFPDLRGFEYSNGIRYLTVVKKVPKVREIKL